MKSSLKPPQPGHSVESGTQSATHSSRLPTMSKAPRADTQLLRAPVSDTEPAVAVAVRRPVVRPRVRRPVRPHLPLRARRQPLAGIGARFLRLEPRDVRRGDHRRQAHGVDVVGAVLAVVRARRVVVARRAQLRRPARRQVGLRSPSPAGSSSPGARSSWSDWAPATRSPRTCPGTPSPPRTASGPHLLTGHVGKVRDRRTRHTHHQPKRKRRHHHSSLHRRSSRSIVVLTLLRVPECAPRHDPFLLEHRGDQRRAADDRDPGPTQARRAPRSRSGR